MLKTFYDNGKLSWMNTDDMNQANANALVKCPQNEETWEEYETSEYAFFPGCQLTAAEPELVIKIYDSLRFQLPDTAIFSQCCGIPAKWENQNDTFNSNIDDIRNKWENLGKPTLIMSCMTCMKNFQDNLPEIPVISLYEMLLKLNISGGCNSENYSYFTVSQDHEKSTEQAVKELASDIGVKLHTMDETEYPMLTHCINCRDMLKKDGLESLHILELIFGMSDSNLHLIAEHDHDHGIEDAACDEISEEPSEDCSGDCTSCSSCGGCSSVISAPLPTIDERHDNRVQLTEIMKELFWGEF